MATALIYIFSQAFYRIIDFFRNWYVGGARFIVHRTLAFLESLDRTFALKVTVEHFFEPLYQDHSVIGHTLGILFRSLRILASVLIYASITAFAGALYGAWAGILTYAVYRSIMYFPQ
jgi:hypothetical protein